MHCHHTLPITTHTTEMHTTTRMTCRQQTPHALLPNTNHHPYSTKTQPCHKDTTLNQQCCDSKHTKEKGDRAKQEGGKNNMKGRTQSQHGTTHTPPRPAIQQGHRVNDTGDADIQTGDTDIRRGASNTTALHSPCHPPSTTAPHHPRQPHPPPRRGGARKGYPTTRTPQTHVHHPHTAASGKEQYTT